MLSGLGMNNIVLENEQYSVFSVKALHLLHLGISKKLKECTVAYFSSTNMPIDPLFLHKKSKKIFYVKNKS